MVKKQTNKNLKKRKNTLKLVSRGRLKEKLLDVLVILFKVKQTTEDLVVDLHDSGILVNHSDTQFRGYFNM